MEVLDQKTTQTISKFTENDVVVVTDRKINEIITIDQNIQTAVLKVKELESNSELTNSDALNQIKAEIDKNQELINDTLMMLTTIGSYSLEYNALVIKGFHKKLKEDDLAESIKSSFSATLEKLIDIRQQLSEPEEIKVQEDNSEEETPTAVEEEKVPVPDYTDEIESLNSKVKTLTKKVMALEDKIKLFMYCGLGVAVITLLSLIFSIVSLAK